MKFMKRKLCLFVSLCLVLLLCTPAGNLKAAATCRLNTTACTLTGVGKKATLKLTAPKKATATWRSSNSKIVSVNQKGVIRANKKGTVTITCTVKYGSVTKKLTCKVVVKVPASAIKFTNVKLDSEYGEHIIELGSSYDFNAARISSSPKSASSDIIRFYIDNPSVAAVNSKTGLVTPLKTGRTKLTVCCGATAAKAMNPANKIKDEVEIRIIKPQIKVTECKLTNSQELKITFSHPMDPQTILSGSRLTSDITLKADTDARELGTLTASLSENDTVLTITNGNPFDGTYDIYLSERVLSKAGYPLTPYGDAITLKDTEGPKYLGCTVDDTGLLVTLNFNEPLSIENLVVSNVKRNDNVTVAYSEPFTSKGNYSLSEDKKSVFVDLSGTLQADRNVSIQLTLYGIVDLVNNPTNPYPLTVSIYTNTTSTGQAQLVNMYRNGNSLVAVFNKSMQIPGYATVNGSFLSGEVNKANKKEIIYRITDSTLLSAKTYLTAVLTNFSTYNATAGSTTAQRAVNFDSLVTPPAISSSALKITSSGTASLVLNFNQAVTLTNAAGSLAVKNVSDGIIGVSTKYSYTAAVQNKTVTITFDDLVVNQTNYSFIIPDSFITDVYYNGNVAQTVTATQQITQAGPLSGPTRIQMDEDFHHNQSVYLTFANMLDQQSAELKSNYEISGVTIQSAQLVLNNYNCPSIVKLTVTPGSIVTGAPYQVKVSGLKGYRNSFSTMNDFRQMVILSSNQVLASPVIVASGKSNSVTLNFSSTLMGESTTKIDFTATMGGTKLTIEKTSISDKTITIVFKETLSSGKNILLTPSVNNYVCDVNNKVLLNMPIQGIIG